MNENPSKELNKLNPIQKWIYTIGVLPTSYLMSMTYEEQLTWLCNYISQTLIPSINNDIEAIQELQGLYEDLQNYVNHYFDNLDVQEEINHKLDQMVANGTLTELIGRYINPLFTEFENSITAQVNEQYSSINQLSTETNKLKNMVESSTNMNPLPAESSADMTDTARIYVNTTNGYWYYYDGEDWTQGGEYQATVSSDDIDELQAKKANKVIHNNLNDLTTGVSGYLNTTNGNIVSSNDYFTTDFIHLANGDVLHVDTILRQMCLYNTSKEFSSALVSTLTGGTTYTATAECYVRVTIPTTGYKYGYIYVNSKEENIPYIPLSIEENLKLNNIMKGEINQILVNALGADITPITLEMIDNFYYDYKDGIKAQSNYHYASINVKAGELYNVSGYAVGWCPMYCFVGTDGIKSSYPYNSYLAERQHYTNIKFIVPADGVMYINKLGTREVSVQKLTPLTPTPSTVTSVLAGKKYCACGDSFTIGDYSNSVSNDYEFESGIYQGLNKIYPRYIALRNNMTLDLNAYGGATMTYISGRDNCFSAEDGNYTQIPADADYITLKFGINDDHQNVTIGNIDDNTNTTYYGAWNIVMDYIIRNHPEAKIGIIISNGASIAIANATKAIAIKWGVGFLDEALGQDVPLMLRSSRTDVNQSIKNFRDNEWYVNPLSNFHPNEKCHEYESSIVESFMKRL